MKPSIQEQDHVEGFTAHSSRLQQTNISLHGGPSMQEYTMSLTHKWPCIVSIGTYNIISVAKFIACPNMLLERIRMARQLLNNHRQAFYCKCNFLRSTELHFHFPSNGDEPQSTARARGSAQTSWPEIEEYPAHHENKQCVPFRQATYLDAGKSCEVYSTGCRGNASGPTGHNL